MAWFKTQQDANPASNIENITKLETQLFGSRWFQWWVMFLMGLCLGLVIFCSLTLGISGLLKLIKKK